MSTFIYANFLAAQAQNLITLALIFIFSINATLITTQHFTLANLLIFPQFAFAGGALDG